MKLSHIFILLCWLCESLFKDVCIKLDRHYLMHLKDIWITVLDKVVQPNFVFLLLLHLGIHPTECLMQEKRNFRGQEVWPFVNSFFVWIVLFSLFSFEHTLKFSHFVLASLHVVENIFRLIVDLVVELLLNKHELRVTQMKLIGWPCEGVDFSIDL